MSGIAASTACQSLHMNCVHLDFRGPSPAQTAATASLSLQEGASLALVASLASLTKVMLLLQVKQVCNLIARRSAALVAACLAGLLKQIGRDGSGSRMQPTTIAVDGGLFEHYQAYRGYLRANLDQLLGRQVSCASALTIPASSPHASLWPDDWCTWAASSSNARPPA